MLPRLGDSCTPSRLGLRKSHRRWVEERGLGAGGSVADPLTANAANITQTRFGVYTFLQASVETGGRRLGEERKPAARQADCCWAVQRFLPDSYANPGNVCSAWAGAPLALRLLTQMQDGLGGDPCGIRMSMP